MVERNRAWRRAKKEAIKARVLHTLSTWSTDQYDLQRALRNEGKTEFGMERWKWCYDGRDCSWCSNGRLHKSNSLDEQAQYELEHHNEYNDEGCGYGWVKYDYGCPYCCQHDEPDAHWYDWWEYQDRELIRERKRQTQACIDRIMDRCDELLRELAQYP